MTSSRKAKEYSDQDISEETVDQILAESQSASKKLSNGLSIVNENSFSNEESVSLQFTARHKFSDGAE